MSACFRKQCLITVKQLETGMDLSKACICLKHDLTTAAKVYASGFSMNELQPERFKTRAEHFPTQRMRELVCNGQLWARAALRQLRSCTVG